MRLRLAVLSSIGALALALALALPVALASTALGIPAPPPATGPGRVCTEIGCQSGVFVRADAYLAAHATVQRVRVCSLGRCRSTTRGQAAVTGEPLVLPVSAERAITVMVTAYDRRGRLVLRRRMVARLRVAQPNGPDCQPVCFQTDLLLSRSGVLTAA